ncbi:hypothetical protein [Selenomonas sp. KH1T6]|uniref:hypothetical protein n=1 Tax=Selenomonas sp. KH1T6 TaxID=3158784 RepID=UPI0008A790CA|nr:hypothetical protein SAMN05216583_103177 [Selenomonas ruminantium]
MARKASETKDLTVTADKGYLVLKGFDFSKAIAEEMEGLTAFFERIKMPSGDTTVFQVPSDNPDEPELVREITAVILYHHPIRAYFKEKYTGATVPPDCGSLNAVEGFGVPGGNCESCPYNAFGSGENNAKACKERRRLYLLLEGEMFPVMLSLPTGSLKEFSRYIMRCLSKGCKTNAVVTRISLAKATNKGGIAYAKAVFHMERELTEDEIPLIAKMSEQIKEISQSVGFEGAEPVEADVSPVVDSEEDDYHKTA